MSDDINEKNYEEVDLEALAEVRELLGELDTAMEAALPDIHTQLEQLNKTLRKRPELTYLLDDEEIQPFYKALTKKAIAASTKEVRKGKGGRVIESHDENGNSLADLLNNMK